jgi:hypothetical protein
MSEYSDILERIADRVPMPEPALDRMERRREKRRRNERVSAGVLGLALTAALGLGLARMLPASTPQPATPSVANGWIAYTHPSRGIFLTREGEAPRLALGSAGGSYESCPAFSADGTRLAFVRSKASIGQLFLADVGAQGIVAGSERALAVVSDRPCPSWSPDGGRLLLVNDAGLRSVDPEGEDAPVELWPGDASDVIDAAWSPDGSLVALADRNGHVWIVSASDGAQVTDAGGPALGTLTWSPDGDRIAMGQSNTGEELPVVLIDVADGDVTELAAPDRDFDGFGTPSWSPDGRSIALVDHHDADHGVVVVQPDEGSWYRLPLPPVEAPFGGRLEVWGAVEWSPDAQFLLVTSGCSVHSLRADGDGSPVLVSSPDVDPQMCLRPPDLSWQPVEGSK